jgi:hypothetical protein
MTDLDPEIWKNDTLGEVGAQPFLDEVEAQALEDANARRENRKPRIAVHTPRHPKFMDANTAPSDIRQIHFVDPEEDADSSTVEVEDDRKGDPFNS